MAIINGTNNDDLLIGTNGSDVIRGLAGNDTLNGNDGNDTLEGGLNDDLLNGGRGVDRMIGGDGNDRYVVDSHLDQTIEELDGGIDTVITRLNNYGLRNNVENLMLLGSANLTAFGNNLDNHIVGNKGNNVIRSGLGDDTIDGGAGFDTIAYRNKSWHSFVISNTFVRGGPIFYKHSNIERVSIRAGDQDNTISALGYSNGTVILEGEEGDDILRGTNNNDRILGGSGDDELVGNDGHDVMAGGDGADLIFGGKGNDTIKAGEDSARDIVYGGEGNDYLIANGNSDSLDGQEGNDTLIVNALSSSGLRSYLYGGVGHDYLEVKSLEGSFELVGGEGNDTLIGGQKAQINYFIGGSGNDVIRGGSQSYDLLAENGDFDFIVSDDRLIGQGTDQIRYIDRIEISAGESDNNLTAKSATMTVVFAGNGGNDTIAGGFGDDQLFGNRGDDEITGGSGNDYLAGDEGSDVLMGGNDHDTLRGAYYLQESVGTIDVLTGGNGTDRFQVGGRGVLYSDGDNTTAGLQDYALITDFNLNDDVIELVGSSSWYTLGASPIATQPGTALFLKNSNGPDELIALIQGSDNLNLSADYFQYFL